MFSLRLYEKLKEEEQAAAAYTEFIYEAAQQGVSRVQFPSLLKQGHIAGSGGRGSRLHVSPFISSPESNISEDVSAFGVFQDTLVFQQFDN